VIATKVGFLGPDGPQDFSPRHIRDSLEASLRRLRTDYVDLYQLHNPPTDHLVKDPEILDSLSDLCRQGKVRASGVSVRSPEDALVAIRRLGVSAGQGSFSMVDQGARAHGPWAWCAREEGGGRR